MGKVYVVNEPLKWDPQQQRKVPVFDITPALEYGSLEYLLPGGRRKLLQDSRALTNVLRHKLSEFTDDDYILAVGHPVAMAIATAMAAAANEGRAKMLYWSTQDHQYLVAPIDLRRV